MAVTRRLATPGECLWLLVGGGLLLRYSILHAFLSSSSFFYPFRIYPSVASPPVFSGSSPHSVIQSPSLSSLLSSLFLFLPPPLSFLSFLNFSLTFSLCSPHFSSPFVLCFLSLLPIFPPFVRTCAAAVHLSPSTPSFRRRNSRVF